MAANKLAEVMALAEGAVVDEETIVHVRKSMGGDLLEAIGEAFEATTPPSKEPPSPLDVIVVGPPQPTAPPPSQAPPPPPFSPPPAQAPQTVPTQFQPPFAPGGGLVPSPGQFPTPGVEASGITEIVGFIVSNLPVIIQGGQAARFILNQLRELLGRSTQPVPGGGPITATRAPGGQPDLSNRECSYILDTLPKPMRAALAAHWCGLRAPYGLGETAEFVFLTIMLSRLPPPSHDACCFRG